MPSSHTPPPRVSGSMRPGGASAPRRSALVVEDDAAIRETLVEVLHCAGYTTSSCEHGRAALEYLRDGLHPDVILLDLMMPVMDGWCFRIEQRKDPELATIPVVALSADGTPKAAAVDADAYLKKPVDFDTLASTVERVVLRRENRALQARLAEADRLTSLGTLAAGMAHEINSPLLYVILNLSYVREHIHTMIAQPGGYGGQGLAFDIALQKKVADALRNAQHGAEQIRSIVGSLKIFSRPEDDSRARVDVRELLESTIPMVKHEIDSRAKLVRDYEEVPHVEANAARLGQVFLNLLLNAAQSLPDGGTHEIRVRVRHVSPNVVVEVHDTGSGIPDDVRGRLFEPFFTTKPVGVGTGLGLSICHGIVRGLGGEIGFDTKVGRGTVFSVTLPALALAAI